MLAECQSFERAFRRGCTGFRWIRAIENGSTGGPEKRRFEITLTQKVTCPMLRMWRNSIGGKLNNTRLETIHGRANRDREIQLSRLCQFRLPAISSASAGGFLSAGLSIDPAR